MSNDEKNAPKPPPRVMAEMHRIPIPNFLVFDGPQDVPAGSVVSNVDVRPEAKKGSRYYTCNFIPQVQLYEVLLHEGEKPPIAWFLERHCVKRWM